MKRSPLLAALALSIAFPAHAVERPSRQVSLQWRADDGTVVDALSRFESAPDEVKSTLEWRLPGDARTSITVSYQPWADRHTWSLADETADWWAEFSLSTDSSYETVERGLREGPGRMVGEEVQVTAELRTSDGVLLQERQHKGQPHLEARARDFEKRVVHEVGKVMPLGALQALDCLLQQMDRDTTNRTGLDSYVSVVDRKLLVSLIEAAKKRSAPSLLCSTKLFALEHVAPTE